MKIFVKARVDNSKISELAKALLSGDLDTSHIKSTYFYKGDPTLGISIWEARDMDAFNEQFTPHKAYYAEVIEIAEMINPMEAQMQIAKAKIKEKLF
ncbi:MAG: hypothetical protein LWX56_01780 [Ignavibacteria bacterium]|nr:hypothetical protein [Ignavibacteria bacterium]